MKTTRAYVINIRKVICFIVLILIAFGCFFNLIENIDINNIESYLVELSVNDIKKDIPLFVYNNETISFIKILGFLLNENLEKPTNIFVKNIFFIESIKERLRSQYIFVDESNNYYINKVIKEILADNKQENIIYNPTTKTTIKSIKETGTFLEKLGITLDNKTSYNVDLNKLYNEKPNIKKGAGKPQVLIVHTHGSESYNPTDRNQDISNNIVRVGSEMAKVFEDNGINVFHSKKMHDIPMFNNSYKNSLSTVTEMIKKNPDICVVLDIHRDAMITEKGEVFKVVKNIKNKDVSQVMFVVGTDQGGLSHKNWKENLKFAIQCQKRLNELAPDIARPINLRKERFNQHTTNASVIIEIGTNGNTLEESIDAGKITAQAISDVLNLY